MTELTIEQLVAQFTLEEIVTELYRDVPCPITFHNQLAEIASAIAAEKMATIVDDAQREIVELAEKRDHYCAAVALALLMLADPEMVGDVETLNRVKASIIEHIMEAED